MFTALVCSVMVSVPVSLVVDRGFDPRVDPTKESMH